MRLEMANVEIKSAKGQKSSAVGGAGETQLDIERYNIKLREAKLKKELAEHIAKGEHIQRKKQNRHNSMPVIALVGYTNAGKTALMNMCSGSQLDSEDRLFMTLDTASRKIRLPNGQKAILMDTVGFITNLPHALVDSFKATLEELHNADLIVHVRDISHPQADF